MNAQDGTLKSAGFIGKSENKVDAKGRLSIPPAFKKILVPDAEDELVIQYVPSGHLLLFNCEQYSKMQKDIMDRGHIIGKEKMWKTIHRLSEHSHLSSVDSQRRITIPAWLLKMAGISKQVLTFGAFDRVSLWAPEKYDEWISDSDIDDTISDLGLF